MSYVRVVSSIKTVDLHFRRTLSAGTAPTNFIVSSHDKSGFPHALFPQESAAIHSDQAQITFLWIISSQFTYRKMCDFVLCYDDIV